MSRIPLRPLANALVSACCACAFAQTSAHAEPPSWWDRVKTVYQRSLKEGKPAAERFVKQFPRNFRNLQKQARALIAGAKATMADSRATLDEKRRLIVQLWEMRQALDLAALANPELLHQLTGLDATAVARLESEVSALSTRLQRDIKADAGR